MSLVWSAIPSQWCSSTTMATKSWLPAARISHGSCKAVQHWDHDQHWEKPSGFRALLQHSYFLCLLPRMPVTAGLTWLRIIFQGIYNGNSFFRLSLSYMKNNFFLLRARQIAKENLLCLKTCTLPPNRIFLFPRLLKINKKSTIF